MLLVTPVYFLLRPFKMSAVKKSSIKPLEYISLDFVFMSIYFESHPLVPNLGIPTPTRGRQSFTGRREAL